MKKSGGVRQKKGEFNLRCWKYAEKAGAACIRTDDVIFQPGDGGGMDRLWHEQAMRHMSCWEVYSAVQEEVVQNVSGIFYGARGSRGCKSFAGFFRVFSDKNAMTAKSTLLVAYLVHTVLLNSYAVYRRFLVGNRLPLVGFWPAKMEKSTQSELSGKNRSKHAHNWLAGTEEGTRRKA